MTPAEKAGILWPMQWVLDTLPHWAAPYIGFVLTFGVMAVGRLIEREPLRLAQQYKGLWPGDAFLGFAIAFMVTGVTDFSPSSIHGWWQSPVVQYAALVVSLVPVVLLTVVEYTLSIKEYNRERRAIRCGGYIMWKVGVYRPYQLFTPTNLLHRTVMVVMAFVVLQLFVATWAIGTIPLTLKVLATLLFAAWAYCGFVYDNQPKHSRPYLPYVHPTHNAWGTKWISNNSQRRPVQQQPTQYRNDVPPAAPQPQYANWVSQNQPPANTGAWPSSDGRQTSGWSEQSPGYGSRVPDYGQPLPPARHFVAPATQPAPPVAPAPQPEPPVASLQPQPGVPTAQPSGRPSFGPPQGPFNQ